MIRIAMPMLLYNLSKASYHAKNRAEQPNQRYLYRTQLLRWRVRPGAPQNARFAEQIASAPGTPPGGLHPRGKSFYDPSATWFHGKRLGGPPQKSFERKESCFAPRRQGRRGST